MPALPNHKHELFVQAWASGLGVGAAYVAVGYKNSPAAATRLSKNVKIQARFAELKNEAAEKAGVSRAWVMEQLTRNARIALGDEKIKITVRPRDSAETVELEVTNRDAAAANKALELLGKEIGMFVERRENTNTNYTISDKPMSKDEWREAYGVETPRGAAGVVH